MASRKIRMLDNGTQDRDVLSGTGLSGGDLTSFDFVILRLTSCLCVTAVALDCYRIAKLHFGGVSPQRRFARIGSTVRCL